MAIRLRASADHEKFVGGNFRNNPLYGIYIYSAMHIMVLPSYHHTQAFFYLLGSGKPSMVFSGHPSDPCYSAHATIHGVCVYVPHCNIIVQATW